MAHLRRYVIDAIKANELEALPLLKVQGGSRVSFKVVGVRIDRVLLGRPGPEHVRVGLGPGWRMPVDDLFG